ncbi:transposase [Allobacillus sp. SKP8-2]|uniref:Transposase n=1 Tax=Allobacillus saliphilus TaxID=2912308 RepID=A0A941HTI9_9BACI|nr:transposase [Allobacillus saliphilus]
MHFLDRAAPVYFRYARISCPIDDRNCLGIDNKRVEQSIKPFVFGRKNWLFSNTKKGADKCNHI